MTHVIVRPTGAEWREAYALADAKHENSYAREHISNRMDDAPPDVMTARLRVSIAAEWAFVNTFGAVGWFPLTNHSRSEDGIDFAVEGGVFGPGLQTVDLKSTKPSRATPHLLHGPY